MGVFQSEGGICYGIQRRVVCTKAPVCEFNDIPVTFAYGVGFEERICRTRGNHCVGNRAAEKGLK